MKHLILTMTIALAVALAAAAPMQAAAEPVPIPQDAAPAPTCAEAGYTYTKLEWCKNICERGYTGAQLDMWIRRWVDRYRDLPACALE